MVTWDTGQSSSDTNPISVLTKKLGYPEFGAFMKADGLAKILLQESGFNNHKFDDTEIEELFNSQPLQREDVDVYLYTSAVFLSELLFNTKNLYRRNKIEFNEMSVLSDVALNRPIPSSLESRLMVDDKDEIEFRDLALSATEHILQGIETKMYLIGHIFESAKATSESINFVKSEVAKIKRYAEIGVQMSEVLKGYYFTTHAGALSSVFEMFLDSERLNRSFASGQVYDFLEPMFRTHAFMKNLPFSGDVTAFSELTGEEVALSMEFAKLYQESSHLVFDTVASGKNKLIVPHCDSWRCVTDSREINSEWKKDPALCIAEFMRQEERVNALLDSCKAPYLDLSHRLHVLGVPMQVAEKIANYLEFNSTDREFPGHKNLVGKQIFKELKSKGKKYTSAVREIVKSACGGGVSSVAYQYYDDPSELMVAPGIGTIGYIVDRDFKLVDEYWSKLSSDKLVSVIKNHHKNSDVYARQNTGCCFVMRGTPIGEVINPQIANIDVRNNFETAFLYDSDAADLLRLQVDAHETVHSRQIKSKLLWRSLAMVVANWVCEQAVIYHKSGIFNKEIPFTQIKHMATKGKSWKRSLRDALDVYSIAALATGKLGEEIRNKGIYEGLHDNGFLIINDGDINYGVLKSVKIEKSFSSNYVDKVRDALMHGNISTLCELGKDAKAYSEDMLSIIEHSAEVYSLLAIRDYLKSENRLNDYRRLKNGVMRRGKMAIQFEKDMHNLSLSRVNLAKHGMKYVPAFSGMDNRADEKLLSLGYDALDPHAAYDNMPRLEKKLKAKKMKLDEVLLPTNRAKAYIGLRYSTQMPLFFNVAQKYGSQEGFEKILLCESLDDVRKLV